MPLPRNAGILAHSLDQGVQYDERAGIAYQADCVRDACEYLGCAPEAVRRWTRNRNADLYLLDTREGRRLLKVLVSKPVESLECEYRSLQELHGIADRTSTFRVPRPVALLEGRSAYLMEFVEGRPLDRLLRRSRSMELPLDCLRDCGRAIGTIHGEWGAGRSEFDVAALRTDLEFLPWRSTARERQSLESALRTLTGRSVALSRLYLDCDPVNVLVAQGGAIVLLDAPERVAVDLPEWDLGAFLFGLERLAWKRPLAARRLRRSREVMRRTFLEGYAEASGNAHEQGNAVLLAVGSLIRLAQLWAWWLDPLGFRHRFAGVARAAYAYPLLHRARRSMFRELDRSLRAGADD